MRPNWMLGGDAGADARGAECPDGGAAPRRAPPPSWAALRQKRKSPDALSAEEREARAKMRRMKGEHGSLWAQMLDAEQRERQGRLHQGSVLSAALRRRLALIGYAVKRSDCIRLERWQRRFQPLSEGEMAEAERAADSLCQGFGLKTCPSGGALPGFAAFIRHMQSQRYVCRVCSPAVASAHEHAFQAAKAREGGASFFAWHGSPLKNWPGIIATGLKVRARVPSAEGGASQARGAAGSATLPFPPDR